MPFFSVVIPLFNKEQFIQDTLKSVLQQTFTDFEIILVNDGSTDQSESLAQAFSDERIRYFSKKNEGASIARNHGLAQAEGQFIAFLDADDTWHANHLEVLKNLIDTHPDAGIYASRYQFIFKNGSAFVPDFNAIANDYTGIVADYFASSLKYNIATSSSIAVRKAVFDEVGNFNPEISSGQDVDMWIRIVLKYPVVIGNEVTASYLHYIENSLSKTAILNKKIKDFNFYREAEHSNPSLKKYLDLYRLEYALQYKMAGDTKTSSLLFQQIDLKNIPWKSRILFQLPGRILQTLKNIKVLLRNKGIEFSIYQ